MDLKDKNLGLLMTRGISLREWDKAGNLERELRPYSELANSFGKIFIFTYGTNSDLKYQSLLPLNIKIIKRPTLIPATLYMFLMPLMHAKIFRSIDIIKTNQMDGSWAGVIAKKLFKKKLIVRCGYEWLNYFRTTNALSYKKVIAKVVERWSYKNADKIVITSEGDKDFIRENFDIHESRIEVVRNYIDTEKFKPDNSIAKESNRIVFVGRLHKDKNLLMLLNSLKDIDCRLVLIGQGSQEQEIRNLASKQGIDIEMLGKVSQERLPQELQKSSIFVLPSKSEGNPKALLEAMSSGLACVGTNVKGIREVISNNDDGLLVELSPESLREKIIMLLENTELRGKLGFNARQKIICSYSLSSVIEKETLIYKNL